MFCFLSYAIDTVCSSVVVLHFVLPGECEPRCVYVCVCERANATQKSRCIIIDSTPYTHRTHTTCIHTLNKCSCICKWLYTTYFFFSSFLFFLLLRSSALCGAVGKCSSCVFIHGIFSSLFSLLFWLVECSIFIFVATSRCPAMRCEQCVYTQYTHIERSVAIVLALYTLWSGFARWLLV